MMDNDEFLIEQSKPEVSHCNKKQKKFEAMEDPQICMDTTYTISPPVIDKHVICPDNTDDHASIAVEAPTSSVHWMECQLTSSEVLVEDLVMDEQDHEHKDQFHMLVEPTLELDKPIKVRFWDQPTPSPLFRWLGDNRMPEEWNRVISEMWEIDPCSKGSLFNYPEGPDCDDLNWSIDDRLSYIVPSSSIETKGPLIRCLRVHT